MFLTDHKVCLRHKKEHVEEEIKKVKEKGFKIVPVGIGPHIDIGELKRISNDSSKIKRFGEYANPEIVGKKNFARYVVIWYNQTSNTSWHRIGKY